MAAAIYPHIPGTQYGPCLGGCAHKDCEQQRRDARGTCRICKLCVGYGVMVYIDPAGTLNHMRGSFISYVHAACLEDELDKSIHEITDALSNDLSKQ